jgi:hypothetical protein
VVAATQPGERFCGLARHKPTAFAPPSLSGECVSDRLLTTREGAEYLHVRPETLLSWDRSGKLRGYRISTNALRWDPDEIEAFLRGTREDGPGARGEVSPAPSAVPTRGVVSQPSPAPSGGEHASRS